MKKLLIIIALCVSSVVAVYGQSNKPSSDTIKKPMTDEQRKYQEYLQWQQKTNRVSRSAQNEKNLETSSKIVEQTSHLHEVEVKILNNESETTQIPATKGSADCLG